MIEAPKKWIIECNTEEEYNNLIGKRKAEFNLEDELKKQQKLAIHNPICLVCLEVTSSLKSCVRCDCFYCTDCFDKNRIINKNQKCPNYRELAELKEISKYLRNNLTDQHLWICRLCSFNGDHLCPEGIIQCKTCNIGIRRKEEVEHNNTCPEVSLKCLKCEFINKRKDFKHDCYEKLKDKIPSCSECQQGKLIRKLGTVIQYKCDNCQQEFKLIKMK